MANILENAFQKAIDAEGEKEDNKRKEAPAIDSVIATGQDFIPLFKLGEKNSATDEEANDAVNATAPELNPNPKPSEKDAATDEGANDVINATTPESFRIRNRVRRMLRLMRGQMMLSMQRHQN
jgi:hypothetical protein